MEAQTIQTLREFLNKHGAICFDDVLLTPRYSTITTRKNISLQSRSMKYPVFSAPMDTVTGLRMAAFMADQGASAVVHRYNTPEKQWQEMPHDHASLRLVFAAVGSRDMDRVDFLYKKGVYNFCIDVAHGHHEDVARAVENIKKKYPGVRIMAGNIATATAYTFLRKAGADYIRVGVGGGSCCTTRIRTGHGIPTLTSIALCKIRSVEEALGSDGPMIIADGGIRNSGDAVKAIAFGADAVMLGSVLAGTSHAPGDLTPDGKKEFRGMASSKAQEEWRGWTSVAEGVSTYIDYKGETANVFDDFIMGIKSGLSYSGAQNIKEFRDNCIVLKQSLASMREGTPHING